MHNRRSDEYRRSWVDGLTAWIDRLPFPSAVFYLAVYLVFALVLHLVEWLNGTLAWGAPSAIAFYNAIWFPLVLGFIHHLDHVATAAMGRFAPLLGDRTAVADSLLYRMTTLPAGVTLALYLGAATVLVIVGYHDPGSVVFVMPEGELHPIAWALAILGSAASYAMAPVLLLHAVRQLRLVSKAYELVAEVNVFEQRRLYAFSGLSMRTALMFQVMVWVTYAGGFLYEAAPTEQAVNVVLAVAFVPASIAIVLLPLMGIHRRLQDAKLEALEDNTARVASVKKKLYAAIEQDDLTQVKGLDEAMVSLNRLQEQARAVPTWPWATGAFRNFVSAISVPLVILIFQTVISRLLSR